MIVESIVTVMVVLGTQALMVEYVDTRERVVDGVTQKASQLSVKKWM